MKLVMLVLVVVSMMSLVWADLECPYEERVTEKVVVQRGDTLWEIAEEYAAPEDDIREFVYYIRDLNNVDPVIKPGTELKVPMKGGDTNE